MRGVEVDLRFGRLRKPPVTPPDLDVAIDLGIVVGVTFQDDRPPPHDRRPARSAQTSNLRTSYLCCQSHGVAIATGVTSVSLCRERSTAHSRCAGGARASWPLAPSAQQPGHRAAEIAADLEGELGIHRDGRAGPISTELGLQEAPVGGRQLLAAPGSSSASRARRTSAYNAWYSAGRHLVVPIGAGPCMCAQESLVEQACGGDIDQDAREVLAAHEVHVVNPEVDGSDLVANRAVRSLPLHEQRPSPPKPVAGERGTARSPTLPRRYPRTLVQPEAARGEPIGHPEHSLPPLGARATGPGVGETQRREPGDDLGDLGPFRRHRRSVSEQWRDGSTRRRSARATSRRAISTTSRCSVTCSPSAYGSSNPVAGSRSTSRTSGAGPTGPWPGT